MALPVATRKGGIRIDFAEMVALQELMGVTVPDKFAARINREALHQAFKPVKPLVKSGIRGIPYYDTGTYAKSIIHKTVKYKNSGTAFSIIGPNPKTSGPPYGPPAIAPQLGMKRRPVKYAHLIELGVKNHVLWGRRTSRFLPGYAVQEPTLKANEKLVQGRYAVGFNKAVNKTKGDFWRMSANFSLQGENFPYVTYRKQSASRDYHMAGSSQLTETSIEVTIYGNYDDIIQIGDWFRIALSGYSGIVTLGGRSINIQRSHLQQESESYTGPLEGQEEFLDVVTQMWEFAHCETAPAV